MKKHLKDLQVDFLKSILENQSFADKKNPVAMKDDKINLYQAAVFAKLTQTLKRVYPVTCAMVGDNLFSILAHQYIIQHPSDQPNMLNYGGLFQAFLSFNQFDKYHLFLPDLARFEWTWHSVFQGKNNARQNLNTLFSTLEKQQTKIKLSLPHNAQLLRLSYPVTQPWFEHQRDKTFSPLVPELGFLLIWQVDNNVKIEPIEQAEYVLLRLIEKNNTLEEVCHYYQSLQLDKAPSDLLVPLCQRGCLGLFKE